MDGFSSLQTLQALTNLLSTKEEDEEEEVKSVQPSAKLGPGSIGPPANPNKHKENQTKQVSSKDIWAEEEVADGSQFDDIIDPRPEPEYEVILRQSVAPEDLFLGMSGKDPSSMCCEGILVKVKLPDTKASEMVLDIREKFLDLRTPKFKLGLHLPHPVHKDEGKARFITEREELEITLLLKRPADYINQELR
ncbi:protein PIH1D3 [Engraulis encrasicolus]|uniref:protein PIH1D3 n=1 Tax=Engraulis encrasicolus TaxID=184585 RepID=UPI002FCE9BCC